MESRKILLGLCLKYNNDWNRIYDAIKNKEDLTDDDFARVDSFTGNYITIVDDAYPRRLKNKYKPPFVLYYEGDINLLKLVDEHDTKNDLIFLRGPNTFNIPSTKLCVITDDNKIDICGGLKVWFNDEPKSVDRFGLAAGLCHNIVCTKIYPVNTRSWFIGVTITSSLHMGNEIYMAPSNGPSCNNDLIKNGASLIDCYADIIPSHESTDSDLPY